MYFAPYAAVEATVVPATNQLHQIVANNRSCMIIYCSSWAETIHGMKLKVDWITSSMLCMVEFPGFQTPVEWELQQLKPAGKLY
jgi:hypothetical protein